MQGHPRKPHSGFVLPQFVPVDQPGECFLKKITFPTLNCDNISGPNTNQKSGIKKKPNTDQRRREMPLWHLEHNGRNVTIVTYLQHDGS